MFRGAKIFAAAPLISYLPGYIMGLYKKGRAIHMMISTKGRYALRVMVDMAEHQAEGYLPLKEIAERQNI